MGSVGIQSWKHWRKHSTTKTDTLESEWKTLMEETQIDTIINKGPNNDITGADIRIISRGNPETQDRRSDGDNDDTQSNVECRMVGE